MADNTIGTFTQGSEGGKFYIPKNLKEVEDRAKSDVIRLKRMFLNKTINKR